MSRSFRQFARPMAQAPTCRQQVFPLYRRQNYDCNCSTLGLARAAHYVADKANGFDEKARTSAES